jgi:dephospho-CoA kinase
VISVWGEQILQPSGEVDRQRLGRIVFADSAELAKLESLVFPWIERKIQEETMRANDDPSCRFVVLDAAILLEKGWRRFCNKVVLVNVPLSIRLERVRARGWSADELARRERAQWPVEKKAEFADLQIENSGTMEETRRQVAQIVQYLFECYASETNTMR